MGHVLRLRHFLKILLLSPLPFSIHMCCGRAVVPSATDYINTDFVILRSAYNISGLYGSFALLQLLWTKNHFSLVFQSCFNYKW